MIEESFLDMFITDSLPTIITIAVIIFCWYLCMRMARGDKKINLGIFEIVKKKKEMKK